MVCRTQEVYLRFVYDVRGSSKEMHVDMTKKRLVIVSIGFLFDQYHIPTMKEGKEKVLKLCVDNLSK